MMKRAFTLIELMISIALGSLIIYIAIAGIQVVSQSITRANKYALDNAVMRLGMQISLDYNDFWTDRDDPNSTNPLDQNLRLTAPDNSNPKKNRGQAFTPFSATAATMGYGPSTPTPTSVWVVDAGRNESQLGWDPNAWHAAAERTWCRVNFQEKQVSQGVSLLNEQLHGRYFLIAAPNSTNIPSPNHPWQQQQVIGLQFSLGVYGLIDYLPANTPFVAYQANSSFRLVNEATDSPWKLGGEWTSDVGGNSSDFVIGGEYGAPRCGGQRKGISDTGGFTLPNRNIKSTDLSKVSNRKYHLRMSTLGDWTLHNRMAKEGMEKLLNDSEINDAVLYESDTGSGVVSNKPESWPSLQVNVLRFFRDGMFVNLHRVVIIDPMTGQSIQVSFTAFGTTLRGARQQRANGLPGTAAGWVDPFADIPQATLDTL